MAIDMHVHLVGNGAGGTGCRLNLPPWQLPMSWFMLRHIGLPISALREDLDQLYVDKLLQWVKASSLDAVVILAQERVYDNAGRPRDADTVAYVPNDYVLRLGALHPAFLPAVSIHPGRSDAFDELESCLASGAVMMKCLPVYQNIDTRDRRYTRFWERMAESGLPLLAHTGS
jgi:predicted TIM-barrel fold metal-dependent hydrolase